MAETKTSPSLKSNSSRITSSWTASNKTKRTANKEGNKGETVMQRKYAYYLLECFVVIAFMFVIYGLIIAYHSKSSSGKNTFYFPKSNSANATPITL